MKEFLVVVATVILAFYIGGTLINGDDANSMKSTGAAVNENNATHMTEMAGW
ncbi:hypothetical protein [Clostridium sp.]|uniref:hypothetical protein n=1 Tax=Clostridium sp. TaxID=1506 RepID=UPI001A59088C|nr:hypothetical protein [Clostridium sp.]MBK5235275.1 hypothetical protein [Clostridium sp.]